ncbi:MAG: bifunctional glutamate N-acetyltransferase/amino-acid acetyltransferase ArgJ [Clostridia bacterium]|nr:bifunctional glutamate N-acetyltransferase/amino-acid acetyltransferase ArgJ [Clostridia bacterium]
MKYLEGGVCAAKGFRANGIHCGIRKNKTKRDLALIVSDVPASAAGAYTTNLVKGAPLIITRSHVTKGKISAIICNSGNANTCNSNGAEVAIETCRELAARLGTSEEEIAVASTGVIGLPMSSTPIVNGMKELIGGLRRSAEGSSFAAEGIMTTDTIKKEVAVEFELGGKTCRIGGIAKGSGMIHPNMATMLVFITSDVAITPDALQTSLSRDVVDSFNMISVDGDTSTNDMVLVLANGAAGNPEISGEGENLDVFRAALRAVTSRLCRMIASDGEGATKLLECTAHGAKDDETARIAAKSVVCSSLLKAAMFGADANWGRVLCAIGYSGADIDVDSVGIAFESAAGRIVVCENGLGVDFSEKLAKKILLEPEITIDVSLGDGEGKASAWGCDLTYDYVRINGDYRT